VNHCRYSSNPTTDVLEKRLAALDGGAAALALASGQAAITAALVTITHSGQNFISANSLCGGTWTLFAQTFRQLGIEVRFFDPKRPEDISKLVDQNTRAVYIETPGNNLPLSRLNFGGLSPKLMTGMMRGKNVATLEELFEAAKELGVSFVACEMAMHILELKKEDLIDQVQEVIGVSTFLDRSRDAKIIFI
jgi:peroxiredoxin family protein